MVSPARLCAHRVLLRVSEQDAYADRAFRAEADRAGLDPRERALAQRLAFGAIQRRLTIDHVLADERIAPLALTVHTLPGTDHRALVAELALPPG